MKFAHKNKQTGLALITMLLVFAVIATLSSEMIFDQNLAVKKTEASWYGRQALEYALGGETYARQILHRDWVSDNENNLRLDSRGEIWASHFEPFEPDNGEILLDIVDAESRFNINNLLAETGQADAAQLIVFQKLLFRLGLPPELGVAIVDWLDADQIPKGYNTEDQGYLGKETAYRTAGQPLIDVSELRAVAGVSEEAYQFLLPHVTAVPYKTAININTAGPLLLESLMDGLNREAVASVRDSLENGFESVDEFLQHSVTAGVPAPQVPVSVTSEYFQARVAARFNERIQGVESWLHRNPQDGAIQRLSRQLN